MFSKALYKIQCTFKIWIHNKIHKIMWYATYYAHEYEYYLLKIKFKEIGFQSLPKNFYIITFSYKNWERIP